MVRRRGQGAALGCASAVDAQQVRAGGHKQQPYVRTAAAAEAPLPQRLLDLHPQHRHVAQAVAAKNHGSPLVTATRVTGMWAPGLWSEIAYQGFDMDSRPAPQLGA